MFVVALGACVDDPSGVVGPSGSAFKTETAHAVAQNRMLERFPEMAEFIPAVSIGPRPAEPTDAQLRAEVASAGGKVMIGLKPPQSAHSRATGVVPAIDRPTALAARTMVQSLGVEITRTYRHFPIVAAVIAPDLAPVIRNMPVVDFIEAEFPGLLMQQTPPQDTTWGLRRISAQHVWTGQYGLPTRGQYTHVTILDSGLDSLHLWSGSGDGPAWVGGDCYYLQGVSASCYDDRLPLDARGHGVAMSGIIAARDNPFGFIGVAHEPQGLASIKVCDSEGWCHPSWVATALDWVIGSGRPRHVVNMSLGFCRNHTALSTAVSAAAANGDLVVASAGNAAQGTNLCPSQEGSDITPTEVMWPAKYASVMAVSGTLENDAFAEAPPPSGGGGGEPLTPCPGGDCTEVEQSGACGSLGSRYGPEVEIAAPFKSFVLYRNGEYAHRCGTSISAAFVSGAAALIWSLNPSWSAGQVRSRLKNTALALSPSSYFGSGRVDVLSAAYPFVYSAAIVGPVQVPPYSTCTFEATTTSPHWPYTWDWFADGSPASSGGSYYHHTAGSDSFTLSARIIDGQGRELWAYWGVMVDWGAQPCDF